MATPQRRRKLSPQAFRLLMLSASFLGVHARLHAQVIGPDTAPPPAQTQAAPPVAAPAESAVSVRERTRLFDNLRANPPPISLISQYLPHSLHALRTGAASNDPLSLAMAHISAVLDDYYHACHDRQDH